MLDALAALFSQIVDPLYSFCGNWWMAIFLFTVIIKIALMPLSLWCQWNSIIMVKMMPAVNAIKTRYYGDAEAIGEKQTALNKEYGYHPMLSLVPLGVQVLILFGLVEVIHGITDGGLPGTEFLGMVPVEDGGLSWAMPFAAALSAVVMGEAQNRINPLQKEQSTLEKNTTNGLSVALSLVLGFSVSAGMAFYWICSNLLSIVVQAACNAIMPASRYVDYDQLEASKIELRAIEDLQPRRGPWWKPDPLAKRERVDYKRFFSVANKHLVVFSEKGSYWKYLGGIVEWLLGNSNIRVHYVTCDPDDRVFELSKSQPRLIPYYIGERKIITLMMKMDADVVLLTMEDLDNYYIKRSYVRKDTEYIFAFHHMTSTHLVAREEAYDNYDAILCVGPHQVEEIRKAESIRDLPKKALVEAGYDLLDKEIADYETDHHKSNARPTVLVAPSWQEDCILDICADEVIRPLVNAGFRVIVRPHPEYVKRKSGRWESLKSRHADIAAEMLKFEDDFSGTESILESDVIITDWSSVFLEFGFTTLKPSVLIDTPMKESNPRWRELGIEPTEISLRNEVGRSLSLSELDKLVSVVSDMTENSDEWADKIREVRCGMVFDLGNGARNAGAYVLDRVIAKQKGAADAEK